jgi:hypothetical protein
MNLLKNIYLLMLRTNDFIPFAAPSTGAFAENSPKGRFRDEARCQRDRRPFWQPSAKARSTGQIGRIADLHALHPKGEAQGCAE